MTKSQVGEQGSQSSGKTGGHIENEECAKFKGEGCLNRTGDDEEGSSDSDSDSLLCQASVLPWAHC